MGEVEVAGHDEGGAEGNRRDQQLGGSTPKYVLCLSGLEGDALMLDQQEGYKPSVMVFYCRFLYGYGLYPFEPCIDTSESSWGLRPALAQGEGGGTKEDRLLRSRGHRTQTDRGREGAQALPPGHHSPPDPACARRTGRRNSRSPGV